MDDIEVAEASANIASRVQYSGATATVIFGLSYNEIGVVIGVIIALFGAGISWYYKHKAYLLRLAEHEIYIEHHHRRYNDKIIEIISDE